MGSSISSFLSSTRSIKSLVFPAPDPPSYNTLSFPNLSFVPRTQFGCQGSTTLEIPIVTFFDPRNTVTILYSHGNGEDLGHIYPWLQILHYALRVNVVGYDYEGYGISNGQSSENACYSDISAVYTYIVQERMVKPENVLIYGRSLGTGPTVDLATKHQVKGVILESPYTSILGVINYNSSISASVDPFRNGNKISNISSPILILHGELDQVISIDQARQLQEKCGCELVTFQDGGHNDLHSLYREDIFKIIQRKFL